MPWHPQRKLGKPIFFFPWRFTLTSALIVLAVSYITTEASERIRSFSESFATKIFICDDFPAGRKKKKILLGKPQVLVILL